MSTVVLLCALLAIPAARCLAKPIDCWGFTVIVWGDGRCMTCQNYCEIDGGWICYGVGQCN